MSRAILSHSFAVCTKRRHRRFKSGYAMPVVMTMPPPLLTLPRTTKIAKTKTLSYSPTHPTPPSCTHVCSSSTARQAPASRQQCWPSQGKKISHCASGVEGTPMEIWATTSRSAFATSPIGRGEGATTHPCTRGRTNPPNWRIFGISCS